MHFSEHMWCVTRFGSICTIYKCYQIAQRTIYTDIFTKHIYATKYFSYKNLKKIIKDENVAILSGDKDSSIVIMQKDDYSHKLQQMIDEEIKNGIYKPTEDNILNDLRKFQDFL